MKEYQTIYCGAEAEFTEKKSRFIGAVAPVSTQTEAMEFIASVTKRHSDATHNVWAYILLEGGQKRYSDDREPQGTAGVPSLEVLEKSGLSDICVVTTRYFGGILLGGGGLCRAYSHAASLAVNAARRKYMRPANRVMVKLDYSLYGKLSNLLPSFGAIVEESIFEDEISLKLLMPFEKYPAFEKAALELSSGSLIPKIIETVYSDIATVNAGNTENR